MGSGRIAKGRAGVLSAVVVGCVAFHGSGGVAAADDSVEPLFSC